MLIVGHPRPCSLNMLYMSYSFLCCCYFATVYSFTVLFFLILYTTMLNFVVLGRVRCSFFYCCRLVVANAVSIVVYFVAVVIVFPSSSSSFFFRNSLFSLTLVKITFRLAFIYSNRFTCNCLWPVTWMGFPFRSTSILPHHFTNYACTHTHTPNTEGEQKINLLNDVFQCWSLS